MTAKARRPPNAGKGRPKGAKNKFSGALKDMILKALDGAGGVTYLQTQAKANPTAFLTLLGKVIPLQVAGASGQPAAPRRVIIELEDVDGDR
jgi:hypothetical protein